MAVSFLDESRLIASEYIGGLGLYSRVEESSFLASQTAIDVSSAVKRRRSSATTEQTGHYDDEGFLASPGPLQVLAEYSPQHPAQYASKSSLKQGLTAPDVFSSIRNDNANSLHIRREALDNIQTGFQESRASNAALSINPPGVVEPSSSASYRAEFGNSLVEESPIGFVKYSGGTDTFGYFNNMPAPEGLPTPPSEKMGLLREKPGSLSHGVESPKVGAGSVTGQFEDLHNIGSISNKSERDYLNSPDEVLFMQVFVDEVGVWMDSLDRDEHFSRIIPFVALKSPMILNAFLACGVKHLTLINKSCQDNKALFYYNTATTQLLRTLQNPDRDIVECATTAVVLNVYEIMSEKPNKRMSHIAGARALIRECGWNAQSKGIGAACFWLNIGMEVLNCLAFNFATAWKPDDWGLDTSFANPQVKSFSVQNSLNRSDSDGKQPATEVKCKQSNPVKTDHTTAIASTSATSDVGDEELWVHRIFYIVAKVVDFRANVTSFHQPSPQDEQLRRQERYEKWKQLKRLCAIWNRDCPRSMRPFSYLFPGQDSKKTSVFPNIW